MLKRMRASDTGNLQTYLESRTEEIDSEIIVRVSAILQDVKTRRDDAVREYTQQFDGILLDSMRVEPSDIEAAAAKADPLCGEYEEGESKYRVLSQCTEAKRLSLQKELGIYLGQRVLPLDSVGIYVPGGRAQYPSSVLMNAIPARIAGVKRIVMLTPPAKDGSLHPNIAAAAQIAGVDEIYKVGGAQGIAALAYGTQSIAPVDKIVGPGNVYVAAAKKLVFGKVDIDMIAGPSEILVIADADAPAKSVAADLLSQAEHDPMASAILVTTSEQLVDAVELELRKQSALLPKKEIVEQSLQAYGTAILCESMEECLDVSNAVAPEHLELMVKQPMDYLGKVRHAGSVFLGYHTCESVGDYFGGCNHVLPTSGTARFSSALGVDSFIKKSSYLHYSEEALQTYGDHIIEMAEQEELQAHANAVKVRLKS